ncbi:MAG: 3-dehydroquinate synthase [Candidatus Omnitrophica bacterium]|nr:3-dehydroquinate synthase [Candidatus Omnitrophota bacterium]
MYKNTYKIIVGAGIIDRLGNWLKKLNIGRNAYIITNSLIKKIYGKLIEKSLKTSGFGFCFKIVADTEKSKSLRTVSLIIKDLVNYDCKRNIFIVALGGGVIGDLAGFVASIYKRGIPYIQIPTTLLAQVDSSIGGKTGIDLKEGKNLLGTFYQPRLVVSDIDLLKTLNKEQIKIGLAEVIKYGLIKDKKFFVYLEKNFEDILNLHLPVIDYIVRHCSKIKAEIVEKDEREEKGLRTILNFGHTIGHAIETAGEYKRYNHGQAVALGLLVESYLSYRLNYLKKTDLIRIETLIKRVGLPTRIERLSFSQIIKAHYKDKKFKGFRNRFALIQEIGKARIVEDIPLRLISEAIKKYLS